MRGAALAGCGERWAVGRVLSTGDGQECRYFRLVLCRYFRLVPCTLRNDLHCTCVPAKRARIGVFSSRTSLKGAVQSGMGWPLTADGCT